MWTRGGPRMKNPLGSVFSQVPAANRPAAASNSPARKKLPFGEINTLQGPLRPDPLMQAVKRSGTRTTSAVNSNGKDVAGTRKRAAISAVGSGISDQSATGSFKLVRPSTPDSRPSKKTVTSSSTPAPKLAHHHRRSPSVHAENVVDNCSSSNSSATLKRRVGQSAHSFSGGIITSTPRPGARPPTSSSATTSFTLRSSPGKSARQLYAGISSRSMSSGRIPIAPHGEVQRSITDNIDLEVGDGRATFCQQQQDHNVQVFIRARPVSDAEAAQQGRSARCVRQENAHTVAWLGQPESTRFTFDHVADEFVSQAELFQVAGLPMVENCMAGYNSCMFAYGQTGSGKTHTMLGDIGDFENRGMTPRVFEYLFARIRKEEEAQRQVKLKYKCRCSFLEIYNEQISDLLEPSATNLQMREDGKKGVFVEGLLEVEVQTVQDVLHLLLLGATNRKVAATHMNRESSRSHSVFTCVIESQWECDSMINFRYGRLNLVDLAGSERQKDTGVDEERLREAASINKSLSTLGLVIMVLVDIANGKQRHVPYRDSKLTFLLQDSLGGNSKTTIIANISPSSCASSETLSTLKFAQRAKFIQNNAVINEEASGDVKGLQEQIHQLKDELARVRRQSIGRAAMSPTVLNHKITAMESLLVGVLRREKLLVKTSAAEIEHLALLQEDETYFHKSLLQSQEPEIRSEACDAQESCSGVPSELEWQCNNLDHMKLAVENIHLQKQLRRRQEYDALEERETMVEDISNLRNKLLDMLDRNISMDTVAAALPQQEALVAELAAEKQVTEQLRNEVEICQRDLSECQTKLRTSLDSNERIARELDALRMELERSRDECSMHKRELGALQLKKALEVNCLELKQAQHQQVVFELKTQLQKSEEKAAQETIKRSQIELQLQEALQESTNLQTELQWTRDSLEEAEAVVETFQRIEPVLEIGDPEAAYEAFMVGQLQAEVIEMHARLEEERRRGRELEDQIKANYNRNLQESLECKTNHDHEQNTKLCNAKGKRKVRHQDAILQLQMELESVDGQRKHFHLSPLDGKKLSELQQEWEGAALRMFDYLLEELPFSPSLQLEKKVFFEDPQFLQDDVEKHNIDIFLSLKKERLLHAQMLANSAEKKFQAINVLMFNSMGRCPDIMESVLQTYQNVTSAKKNFEACNANLREVGQKSALASIMEWWMSEISTIRHRVTWDGKKRQLGAEKELLEIQVQSSIDVLENILSELTTTEAQLQQIVDTITEEVDKKQTREQALVTVVAEAEQRYIDLQHQIELKEEEIVKLKEQAAEAQEQWVLEKAELLVAIRESEDMCVRNNQTITNMQRTLPKQEISENETVMQVGERLGNKTSTEFQAMENLSLENDIRIDANPLTIIGQQEVEDCFSWSEEKWNNVAARDFKTSKIVVLESCEAFPPGKVTVELTRTNHVLLTESDGKVKLLSEMVAKVQKNWPGDHLEAGSVDENLENLRSSSLCKEMTLSVNIIDQEYNILKALVFSLDTENADLQNQLLKTEADSTALKSTIANLQRELQEKSEELHVSDRHIFKLECQSVELRDEMKLQAVAFGVLYEQFQKQEGLQMLEEERAALRDNADRYQAETRQLQSQVEALQQELERMQPLREEIVLIYHTLRTSAATAAQETEQLRSLVEDLEKNKSQLQKEVKRKLSAIQALEKHLLAAQQKKVQCQEDLHRCKEMAEANKTRAQEKQVEVEILAKSVEELENTVYALQSQVGLLKKEGDRQRLVREDMESELQALKYQNAALTEASSTTSGGAARRESTAERKLEHREGELQVLRKKLEKYEMGSDENASFPQLKNNIHKGKKNALKRSTGFRCFNLNHQVHSELDEERKSYQRRILELEGVLANHQHEVTVLKEKLEDAEGITRAALRALRVQRGVKLVDMANIATPDEQQEEHSVKSDERTLQKDEEVERMISQLNAFIDERESWLELISRKQNEMTATRAAMEKLREREKELVAENKKFKNESRAQLKKIGKLEEEINVLSGQQMKPRVKFKDENNALRIQNNDLSAKMRHLEHVNVRVSEELAKYRIAQGRKPLLNIEEEQRLRTKLQEAQEHSCQVAQKLASFSASVMKAAGMLDRNVNDTDSSSVALEALKEMKSRLLFTQLELEDFKLKARIAGEWQKLSQMQTEHSPMRGIDAETVTAR